MVGLGGGGTHSPKKACWALTNSLKAPSGSVPTVTWYFHEVLGLQLAFFGLGRAGR